MLGGIVAGAALLGGLLTLPIGRPRIFGDELIYWELSRAFAWTGHFTVRGGAEPHYGYVYPAVLAVAQRLGHDQHAAYAIAQGLNILVFSLSAIPAYAIARRVLRRQALALVAAGLAVAVPSCLLTSAIMTENAFYPLFLTSALLMLQTLERPTWGRQLLMLVAAALTFLTRAQAVVLVPAYLLAVVLLGLTTHRLAAALRQHVPTFAAVACAGIAAAFVRSQSTLGPYHVLVASYQFRSVAHWALANLADIELYVGVVPLVAFGILLVRSLSSPRMAPELRALTLLSACLGAGLLATVAALSSSQYGLQRVHERNLFYVVPLVLIVFLAWLESGAPRPRRTAVGVAALLVVLPFAIPPVAIGPAGEDGLAVMLWSEAGLHGNAAHVGMAAVAAVACLLALARPRAALMIGITAAVFAATLAVGERHAASALRDDAQWRDGSWIDHAVGADARVVGRWATSHSGPQGRRIEGAWSDEFFNRSIRDVASADGPLPDGLPIRTLRITRTGCLQGALPGRPAYAVLETVRPLDAPVVAVSPSGRSTLYRLPAPLDRHCFARLR